MTEKDYKPNGQPYRLSCTCCGSGLKNTPEENACYNESPYPQDTGFGQCRSCFGQDKNDLTFEDLEGLTEKELWAFLGSVEAQFYKTRFELMSKALNEKNSAEFESFPLVQKFYFVQQAVLDGIIA